MQNYFQRFVLDGGIMMIFLIPTSIIALACVIRGLIMLRREKIAPNSLLERAGALANAEERARFRTALGEHPSPLAQVAYQILLQRRGNPGNGEKIMGEAVADAVDRLHHTTSPLAVIYTIAPLMGLLGTIMGMMRTFYDFALREERSVAILSEGINMALVTTLWGLFIAIPAYIFLSILRHKIFLYEKDILPQSVRRIVRACTEPPKSQIPGKEKASR